MPKPKKNESKDDYISRCIAELVNKENKPSNQAVAICNSFWREKKDVN